MPLETLQALLVLLRAQGVTHFAQGDLTVTLGALPSNPSAEQAQKPTPVAPEDDLLFWSAP